MAEATDRIVKSIVLRASREGVWTAIGDAAQFGRWFGAELDGPFVPGAGLSGRIVPTSVDSEVARSQEPHASTRLEIWVERIEPMRLLAFRWHPYAVAADADYTREPTTRVEFHVDEVADGTRVTITESGFDRIPAARRAEAFTRNEQGWAMQTRLLAKFLGAPPLQRIFEVHYIRSTPEAVWRALTDPDITQRYWVGTRIVSDWRAGSMIEYWRNGEITDRHIVLAVDAPRLLSHTFHPLFGDYAKEPPSRVTFRIDQHDAVVRLTVQHDRFGADSQVYRACSDGWPVILSGLKTLLECGEPLPEFEFAPQPARFEPE